MAYDHDGVYLTLSATTGLTKQRFVTVNSAGKAAYPAAGAVTVGVLTDIDQGTTGSATDQVATIQVAGVAKVSAPGSTLAVGDSVAATSVGRAKPSTGQNFIQGIVVSGSSGSTGRVLSVLLRTQGRASS